MGNISCSTCGGRLEISDENELACTKCGVIAKIKESLEDLAIQPRKKYSSISETKIGDIKFIDGKRIKEKLNSAQQEHANKIRKYDKYSQKIDQRRLSAENQIKSLSAKLNLPTHIAESALIIYDKCRKKILKGRNNKLFATSCVFLASRNSNNFKSLENIAIFADIDKNDITKMNNRIKEIIDIQQEIPTPLHFLAHFRNRMQINIGIESRAKKILEKYRDQSGKSPKILMASALYLAHGDDSVKLDTLADIAECTVGALRKRVKEMEHLTRKNL